MADQAKGTMLETTRKGPRGTATVHESFLVHRNFRYLKIAALLCLATLLGYVFIDVEPRHNGGSWYGYLLGTIGALLILWLTYLGIRKRNISPGRWSLKSWTSAHVYLGLSLIVVATLHAGFQFGWNVHTLSYVLMMIVILSGVFGIWAYARFPRMLSDNRGNATQVQMIEEIRGIDKELMDAARPLEERYVAEVRRAIDKTRIGGSLMTKLSGTDKRCATAAALATLSKIADGATGEARAALYRVIQLLNRKTALLARARRHIQIRSLLEVWLYIHVPVTIALLAALTAHIISVFFYW